MKRFLPVAMAFLAIPLIGCGRKARPIPSEISFMTDFGKAKAEALKTNKPMIIDFYTDWCKWCHTLDTLTYVDSLVIAMSLDDIFVKVNAEIDTALAQKYGISGYPTIVITRPNGEEIDRIWGFLEPTDFYNQVQSYLLGKETLEDYLSRLQDEPQNLDYLSTVAEKYASRSQFQQAIEYYNKVIQLDPDNKQGYALKALASIYDTQSRTKDYVAAIGTCKEIIAMYPQSPEADDAAAMIAYFTDKNGDEKGALVLYRDYLARYPHGRNDWVKKRLADLEEKL